MELYNTTMSDSIRKVVATLVKLVARNQAMAAESNAAARAVYVRAKRHLPAFVGIAALFVVGAALMLVLAISRPLARMTAAMHRLAAGDTATAIRRPNRGTRSVRWGGPCRSSGTP